jgi:hypothetical protein
MPVEVVSDKTADVFKDLLASAQRLQRMAKVENVNGKTFASESAAWVEGIGGLREDYEHARGILRLVNEAYARLGEELDNPAVSFAAYDIVIKASHWVDLCKSITCKSFAVKNIVPDDTDVSYARANLAGFFAVVVGRQPVAVYRSYAAAMRVYSDARAEGHVVKKPKRMIYSYTFVWRRLEEGGVKAAAAIYCGPVAGWRKPLARHVASQAWNKGNTFTRDITRAVPKHEVAPRLVEFLQGVEREGHVLPALEYGPCVKAMAHVSRLRATFGGQ